MTTGWCVGGAGVRRRGWRAGGRGCGALLVAGALVCAWPGRALAQEGAGAWVRLGGPSGGIGYDIKTRPDNPDHMYVTDAQAGVHMSTDGGATWVSINAGIDARSGPSNDHIPAFCLTIDPNAPNVLWVGTQNSTGVYRSSDAGVTWEKRTTGITETVGLTIRGITVMPGNSSVVYAAGEIGSVGWAGSQQQGREFDLVKGVVYKSVDGGARWTAVWRGDNLARYVLLDPASPDTVYVSTGIFDREAANSQPALNIAGGVGILKSTNGGATWSTINAGLGNLYVGSLAMSPADSRTLVAGTGHNTYPDGGGIYLTQDGGDTWRYVAGTAITSVEFAGASAGAAYAAGSREFFRSDDGGLSWRAVLNRNGRTWGPPGLLTGFPIDLQADARDALRLFVNNYGGGNFLTADGGLTWGTASTGYTGASMTDVAVSRRDPALVYVNTKTGPFKSTDGGLTWTGLNPISLRPVSEGARVAVDPEDDQHLVMSSAHQGSTYESQDGGTSWRLATDYDQELRALLPAIRFQQGMQAMVFAPSWRLKVYGGFGVQACVLNLTRCDIATIVGVLTSEDGGRTWTRRTGTGFDTVSVPAIAVHPLDQNIAWAGTIGLGVFRTTDGGATWTAVNAGLTDLNIESLAVDPAHPELVYAGTVGRGVFRSRDYGVTWAAASTGMPPTERINAIVVHPTRAGVVYAGSHGSGVYLSVNGGTTWTVFNAGLRSRSIRAMAIAADGSVIYAATFGEGVFRLGTLPQAAPARVIRP